MACHKCVQKGQESGREEERRAGKEERGREEEGKRLPPNGTPFTVSAVGEAVLSGETIYMLSEASPPFLCSWPPLEARGQQESGMRPGLGPLLPDLSFPPRGSPKTMRLSREVETLTWGSFAPGASFQCPDSPPCSFLHTPRGVRPRRPREPRRGTGRASLAHGVIPVPRRGFMAQTDPCSQPTGRYH